VQQDLQEASRPKPSRQKFANPKRLPATKLSGGDVDAVADEGGSGEETVGGSVATPDQDIVENLGRAAGVTYEDNEELKPVEKVKKRDRKRWELNPSSSEDYQERLREDR
jgi:ParB-like chromosome segregation protein Spo0J